MTETFYQYKCTDCELSFFTAWKSSTESSKPFCPNCGNDQTSELTGEEIEHG